jgi:hypothetical protein
MPDTFKPTLTVVGIDGRYPRHPGRFDAGNMHVQVIEYADGVFVVRVDDEKHDDGWWEVSLKLLHSPPVVGS